MWSRYGDYVRGCASEGDGWLRQYQQQDEQDALEIARILSIQVNDITSFIFSERQLLTPTNFTDFYVDCDLKTLHILFGLIYWS